MTSNQEKLDEIYNQVEEIRKDNEHMLKEIYDMHDTLNWIRRRERVRFAITTVYWVAVIGLAFGAYYYIQPLLSDVLSGGILKTLEDGVANLGDFKAIQSLINDQ